VGEMDLGGDSSRLYFYDPIHYLFSQSLYSVSQSAFDRLKRNLKNKYIAAILAVGVGLIVLTNILQNAKDPAEAAELINDPNVTKIAANEVGDGKSLFGRLFASWKITRELSKQTRNEIVKRIATIIASFLLLTLYVLMATVFLKPVAQLLAAIDLKLTKLKQQYNSGKHLLNRFCIELVKLKKKESSNKKLDSSCFRETQNSPIGPMLKTFFVINNILFSVFKIKDALAVNSFCEYFYEKVCRKL
jgi:hypothetical protein